MTPDGETKPAPAGRAGLYSIHDVMPATLDRVRAIVDTLNACGVTRPTLLVVPGKQWSDAEVATLAALARGGAELAGHGWTHAARHIRGLRHRLHSVTISRNVAEHLALSRAECADLVRRCHTWFADHELPAPTLYVPPAWAMGDLGPEDLDALPFTHYEALTGVYVGGRFTRLGLLGFEADTRFRAVAVRFWNRLNTALTTGPIRVSIHPDDFTLHLADDLRAVLESGLPELAYSDLGEDRDPGTGY